MKIAVISSYAFIKNNNNYGALLQYYALQNYLENKGHKVYWIKTLLKGPKRTFFTMLRTSKSIRLSLIWNRAHKGFMNFVKCRLNTSKKEYKSFDSINECPPEADVYITGSDQVWGGTELKENYLLFAPSGCLKIAYAASFGKDSISDEMQEIIRPWLKNFELISVREPSGVDICRQMGLDAIHLLDPTFLLGADDYPHYGKSRFKRPYIYCYFLNVKSLDDVHFSEIVSFAKQKNLEIHVCAVQGAEKLFESKYLTAPTPEEWITDYRFSSYVFTNTFHGTVFALIHQKKFVSFLQNGPSAKQNTRMTSLLKFFDLTDNVYTKEKSIDSIVCCPIHWESFEQRRKNNLHLSDTFINTILNRIC